MKVVGWPNNVNMKILAETSITTGEGGFVEDSSSNGHKERRATSLVTPRKYNVTMDFDWGGAGSEFQSPRDANGLTEYDRFENWYKFVHQKGTCPFWFPCITKQSIDNLQPDERSTMCLYKITSTMNESQSGYSQRITMTWEEVYSGIINIPYQVITLTSVSGRNGKAKLFFDKIPDTIPLITDITLEISKNSGEYRQHVIDTIGGINDVISITYPPLTENGTYSVKITYKDVSKTYEFKVGR